MSLSPSQPDLREVQDRFVAAWGQMGAAWGISRTMAEVHALLYITGRPLNTDEIMDRLQISRGNASMSLRSLLDWGVVARVHRRGDRKEYFQAEQDVWAMFRAIVRERLKREVDPLLAQLYEIRDLTTVKAEPGAEASRAKSAAGGAGGEVIPIDPAATVEAHNKRLESLLEFIQVVDTLSRQFVSPAGAGLKFAAKLLTGGR